MSPVGAVAETEKCKQPEGVELVREKLRVAHDLSFPAGWMELDGEQPVNTSTYFEDIPEYEKATVMKEVSVRLIGLRVQYPREGIPGQKMDVKRVLRQTPVSPAGAPAFSYVVWDFLVVDLRLHTG